MFGPIVVVAVGFVLVWSIRLIIFFKLQMVDPKDFIIKSTPFIIININIPAILILQIYYPQLICLTTHATARGHIHGTTQSHPRQRPNQQRCRANMLLSLLPPTSSHVPAVCGRPHCIATPSSLPHHHPGGSLGVHALLSHSKRVLEENQSRHGTAHRHRPHPKNCTPIKGEHRKGKQQQKWVRYPSRQFNQSSE